MRVVFIQCFVGQMSKFKRQEILKKKSMPCPYLAAVALANYWVQVGNTANGA